MIRCEGCGRHVREAEESCPFCARSARRGAVAHKAMQWMGGAATTVVLAACYGGPDIKYDSGYPTGAGTAGGTTTGTMTGIGTGTPTGTTGTPCAGGTGFQVTVDWTDVDGADPSDSDGDGLNDTDCTSDTVDVDVCDPLGVPTWSFGMAEDGPSGWTGEDCFNGQGTALQFCHPLTLAAGLSLTEVCTPGEVVDGQTTLLDASKDPFLTYYLEDANGSCFVFGTDPAYYATLGCTEMM